MTDYRVAVIGLGAMGFGMAMSAKRAGLQVSGYDVSASARERFQAEGGTIAEGLEAAVGDADAVCVVVVNQAQTESVLFGPDGIVSAMKAGAVLLSCATVPPAFAIETAERVQAAGLHYLDAPISGGAAKSLLGKLSVMASGSEAAFAKAATVLDAVAERVFRLGDTAGPGSTMKMVNQLLAGVHIATAMEAMALGIKSGLPAETIFEVITASAGNSWMFENRVPHVLDGDYAPKSAVDIFVKDLGIVLEAGKREAFPLPLSAAAHQQFLAAKALGLGREDDAAVIKVFAALAGIDLPKGR